MSTIDARLMAAVAAGKVSGTASRLLGRGGGSALPGLVATRLEPNLVRRLSAQLPGGAILVSGTNGKTTTSRMLGIILSHGGFAPLRNKSGSNLMRGVASALLEETNLLGSLSTDGRSLGLFEVDEAALPEILAALPARTLVLLDLFRDQLDRYGEVATVARHWSGALEQLPASTSLVLNGDDPLIREVAGGRQATYFGVESWDGEAVEAEHASDVKACPRCGGVVAYSAVTLGHLGHYRCTVCDLTRPTPNVSAWDVRLHGVEGSSFRLVTPWGEVGVKLPLPGMYNVYNALAAAAAAGTLGLSAPDIGSALAKVSPAFGRMERLQVDGRLVLLALAKNPAGLNEVLRTLLTEPGALHLLVMLNDNTADGKDVSWIWDADVEMLGGRIAVAVFAGTRKEDMALRFKYAGALTEPVEWKLDAETKRAFVTALDRTPPGEKLFIVPTYTALLDIRTTLTRLGYVRPYWED
jgi:UDP-N-acetylmuramyl tripeptide synthase